MDEKKFIETFDQYVRRNLIRIVIYLFSYY